MIFKPSFITFSLLIGLSAHAAAKDLLDFSLEELGQIKVYSSTLYEESLFEAHSSVTIIKQEEIKSLNARRLTTLMNYVPGFQSYKSGESALHYSYSSRGRRVGTSGREVLVLIDGHRVNDDWTGGAAFTDTYISLENAKQVEFIRGPGSAIYGSNAFLGVINIITVNDQKELAVGTTNIGGHNISGSYTYQTGELNTSIFVKSLDNNSETLNAYSYIQNAFVNTEEKHSLYDIYLKAQYKDFAVNFKNSQREDENYYVSGIPPNELNWVKYNTNNITLRYETNIDENFTLFSKIFLNNKNYNVEALVAEPNILVKSIVKQEELGGELRLDYHLNNIKWLNGIEWRQPDIVTSKTKLSINPDYNILSTESSRTIAGLYSQFQHNVSERFDYIIGARFDDYSDVGSNISPRLGLNYSFSEAQSFKLFYGESFRSPTRIERDIQNSGQFIENPDIKPEISKTIELIYQTSVNQQYFTSTLFFTTIDDAITQSATTPAQRINSGEETIEGIEIETINQISDNLVLRNAFTYIYNMPQKYNEESEMFGTSSLTYTQGVLSFNIGMNYQGDKSHENTSPDGLTIFGGKTIFSSHINYYINKDINIYLSCINIFDKAYNLPGKSARNIMGIPSTGRKFELGVRWTLK